MSQRRAPSTCAICGADIPPKARACPECGADERTGWAEQDPYDGLDLPDDEDSRAAQPSFERDPTKAGRPQSPRDWFWWAVAAALLAAIALSFLLGVRS